MYLGAHTIETIHLLHLFPSQIAYREFAPYFILLPSLLEVPNESKHVSVELAQIGTTNSTSTETVFSDKTLQNLLIFYVKENPCSFFRFSFWAFLSFYFMNALVYDDIDQGIHK